MNYNFPNPLTLALEGVSDQFHSPGITAHSTHWTGDQVDHRVSLDTYRQGWPSCLCHEMNVSSDVQATV